MMIRCLLLVLANLIFIGSVFAEPISKHPGNGRWFREPISGRAIALTGSHTWDNMQDVGPGDPPTAFNWGIYLSNLTSWGHNFIRLWSLAPPKTATLYVAPPWPWPRTGGSNASDGKPQFDVSVPNQAYYDRLRQRCIEAGNKGIYVGIMFFNGVSIAAGSTMYGFPFDSGNNVNSIALSPRTDYLVHNNAVQTYQENHVKKVIDTVNDLDNVIFEIANESGFGSKDWQYHMIDLVQTYEAANYPTRLHMVGMSDMTNGTGDFLGALTGSAADFIMPGETAEDNEGFDTGPPVANGDKSQILDSDHVNFDAPETVWFWKSFVRGYSPIYLDSYNHVIYGDVEFGDEDAIRTQLGQVKTYAENIRLFSMIPSETISTTTYALYNSGDEYLVYQPIAGNITVDLPAGTFFYEYFRPSTGAVTSSGTVTATSGLNAFIPAYYPVVLHLKKPPRTMN
jgi:hypothetical protein